MKSRFNGALLIIAGGIALAHNLGYLRIDLTQLLRVWWPGDQTAASKPPTRATTAGMAIRRKGEEVMTPADW